VSSFGSRHRELREEAGQVMQDIADLFGQTRTAVALWEAGKTEPPYDTLLTLADHFGVTVDYLLGRPGARRDSPRVEAIKADLHEYLRLMENQLADTTTAERMAIIVNFLTNREQALFSEERIASRLLIKPVTLRRAMQGQSDPGPTVIERLADCVGLPVAWFYVPRPRIHAQGTIG